MAGLKCTDSELSKSRQLAGRRKVGMACVAKGNTKAGARSWGLPWGCLGWDEEMEPEGEVGQVQGQSGNSHLWSWSPVRRQCRTIWGFASSR